MAYWLLKTEPKEYSWWDLEREGSTIWNGVSNALALKYLRNMETEDLALIYHTGKERRIMGIAKVISQPYPDPKLNDIKRVVVNLQAVGRVPSPVTLAQIKQDSNFKNFELVRLPRLSVVPMSQFHYKYLLELMDI